MTIGFDGSRAFVENRTGTENYSYHLLKALAEIDTENSYLIYIRESQKSKVKSQKWPDNFKFKVINFPRLWTQVGLAFRTFIDPLDILFVPSHTLPLIRKPGLKTVITVHDLGAEYLPGFHQLKQVLYLKLMTRYQLKSASKIIAVSSATKKDLIKKIGIEDKKIEVVYEAAGEGYRVQGIGYSSDTQRDILKQFGIEKGKYFLFVGTIQPRKNLERLIRAFANFLRIDSRNLKLDQETRSWELEKNNLASSLKNQKSNIKFQASSLKLIMVGQKGWKSDNIYNLPKELGLEEQVQFLGRVSDQDLKVLYSNAVALTYPSLFEGFGLPILEAFVCGCPVITSNNSSMPEVAGDAAILVNPESETEIFNAMAKIVKDDKLRDTLIQKGYRRLKDFSWEKCAKQTLEILRTVD